VVKVADELVRRAAVLIQSRAQRVGTARGQQTHVDTADVVRFGPHVGERTGLAPVNLGKAYRRAMVPVAGGGDRLAFPLLPALVS
jgi:hypothetical protein